SAVELLETRAGGEAWCTDLRTQWSTLTSTPTPVAPAVTPSTFRRSLKGAGAEFLTGPVRELFPHLLRHACAAHNYENGMSLWEVQKLLGHIWATTTVRYLASVHADPEAAGRDASERAAQRLLLDQGNLR
ncbi:tyrosine-type recombinase/integrase, partial [Streptomyces sp. NPDC048295]|uniref:tyrosine-type recombinase/integrase n=1 Tax=Streptomyces sp. NPDC048295 TaxID=3154617 RepID=UPI003429A1FF